jgi:hypothetical protein
MPTIDQLAPATAATDADVILVSQNGTARKITRAKILSGVQPALAIPAGTLLGRVSTGIGAPETIALGSNLSLSGSTLIAAATPFSVSQLAPGSVPAPNDAVPLGQNGTNTSVTFSQFLSGLPGVANVNASQALVFPTGSSNSVKLADLAATMLPTAGGTMTGPLVLSGAPAAAAQAANKSYVDGQIATALPKAGGTLSGSITLASDPTAALQAATKNYVDGQVATALSKTGGIVTGTLTLSSDPATALQAATKQYVDSRTLRGGDTMTGPLVLAGDPTAPLQATTKGYVDGQTSLSLAKSGGTLTGAVTLPADPTGAMQAATKQYVDTRVFRNGDTLTGALQLAGDPVLPLQAATKAYVDTQAAVALPKSGGSMTGFVLLSSDPALALHAATKQYADTRVLRNGDTLTGNLTLSSDPVSALQAATKQYVDNQVGGTLPKAGGTMTGPLSLSSDPTSIGQAATKRYVDAQVGTALPLNGGTITGPLTLNGSPAAANQAATKQYVDGQVSTALPLSGGTLAGALTLASSPTNPMGAATKQYVDSTAVGTGVINVKATPYNALLNGVADDTAAFKAAYLAAPAGSVIYVPFGVAVLQNPNNWGISLTKRVKWVVDGTTLVDGTPLASAIPNGTNPAALVLPGLAVGNTATGAEFSLGSSKSSDLAVLHSSYIVNHNGGTTGAVLANARTDTIIYNSPNDYVWGGLDRLIWTGVQTPTASTPAQHVGRYMQTIRQTIGTNTSGAPLPQPQLWAACLEMRDTTGQPSSWSNASLTVEMDLIANGLDDGNNRQIQSLVVQQHNTAGAPVEVGTIVGVYLAVGSSGRAKTVFNVGIPFNRSVLDTTNAVQLAGGSAIRLAAGHTISFEPSGNNNLAYDSTTGTLRWNQGSLSYVVGKGITVGWQYVAGGNTTLPNYIAGDLVFLVGSGAYTVTLPAANTVPAGVGFTFTCIGTAVVTISPSGSDTIDNGPVVLRPNDRYHIVSDGSTTWREIFRTNAVAPRFLGPPVFPSYTVAALPALPGAGAKAFTTNGRKPADAAGSGTGVEVFFDGTRWISVCSGTQVSA